MGAVRALLSLGAEPNLGCHSNGASPLHAASQEGHAEVVRTLLSAGALADTAIHGDFSPLFFSCLHGFVEVALVLVSARAPLLSSNDSMALDVCSPEMRAQLLEAAQRVVGGAGPGWDTLLELGRREEAVAGGGAGAVWRKKQSQWGGGSRSSGEGG